MLRLDAESEVARTPRDDRRMPPAEVVAYSGRCLAMWADSGLEGRRALATALFACIDVEVYQRMEYELTPDASKRLGLSAALPAILEAGGRSVSLVGARGIAPS